MCNDVAAVLRSSDSAILLSRRHRVAAAAAAPTLALRRFLSLGGPETKLSRVPPFVAPSPTGIHPPPRFTPFPYRLFFLFSLNVANIIWHALGPEDNESPDTRRPPPS